MSLRLAVATEDFGTSLRKSIGLSAACRVAGIRLNTRTELDVLAATRSQLRQVLLFVKERQMSVAGLLCPTRHSLYDESHLEERLNVIRKSMSLASELETRQLLVRCGPIPSPQDEDARLDKGQGVAAPANPFAFDTAEPLGKSPQAEFRLLVEILNDLAKHGNHVGCTLQLQLTSFNLKLILQLLESVTAGPMQIVFDPAIAVMTGRSPVGVFRDCYEQVGYVRARDAIANEDFSGEETSVGKGAVDWVELMPTLIEADFDGWVCVERTGGEFRRQDVSAGVLYLNQLIPGVDD